MIIRAKWSVLASFALPLAAQGHTGKEVLPGVWMLSGQDLERIELADPYLSVLQDSVVVSGTAQFHLKFRSLAEFERGGPYRAVWNRFYYADGTPIDPPRTNSAIWDLKPVLWSSTGGTQGGAPRLWDPTRDLLPPMIVWYGGRMRAAPGQVAAHWPRDNYGRDVFPFLENAPGKWFSLEKSVFSDRGDWPRPSGNHLGHRYGHQIVTIPRKSGPPVAVIFYEQVTQVNADGSPSLTKIFMDEMATPFRTRGKPIELFSPMNSATGHPYPSTHRETGAHLVEGPLYFRFKFEGEEWEAIGFSAGSYYADYPSCFAARRVSEGLEGKPYRADLNDDGSDLHDAGLMLRTALELRGGPGRPAVVVRADGSAILDKRGRLQVLVHAYRKGENHRITFRAPLLVTKSPSGALRFRINVPNG